MGDLVIEKEAWHRELEAREMSLPYDPTKEPGGALEEDGCEEEDGQED